MTDPDDGLGDSSRYFIWSSERGVPAVKEATQTV